EGTDLRRIVVDIVGDDEVEPAVAVVIEEAGRRGPQGVFDSGGLGDVDEGAVAVVAEEADAAVFGNENVGETVVVDVGDGDAHAVTADVEAGAGADVFEAAVGFLVVQPVARRRV